MEEKHFPLEYFLYETDASWGFIYESLFEGFYSKSLRVMTYGSSFYAS